MKANEVLKILGITRMTLSSYVKKGYIKVSTLPTGKYIYDSKSVFKFMKKDNRQNIIYARVSTYKQKNDLNSQINKLNKFCKDNDIIIDNIYSEISSGLDLERNEFSKLLTDVLDYKVNTIYITHKDRLTRLSFRTIKQIFDKFETTIVVIDKTNKSENSEILEELISLMHIFSTKMYSNRRIKNKIDLNNDLSINL